MLRARDESEAALNTLFHCYRQPLISWLLARGYRQHDAEDIVQGFFARALSRNFLSRVGAEKGRFRTFLLTCLRNYVIGEHEKAATAKRGRGYSFESLDAEFADEASRREPAAKQAAPDLEYDRAWATAVLRHALRRLNDECAAQGHVLLLAELEPVLFDDETAGRYREIAAKLGMNENSLKVAAHRIRNRLNILICTEIRETVASQEELDDEIRYLIELFGR